MAAKETVSDPSFNKTGYTCDTDNSDANSLDILASVASKRESIHPSSSSRFDENKIPMPKTSQTSAPFVIHTLGTPSSHVENFANCQDYANIYASTTTTTTHSIVYSIPTVFGNNIGSMYAGAVQNHGGSNLMSSEFGDGYRQMPMVYPAQTTTFSSTEVVHISSKKCFMCEYCVGVFDDYYSFMHHMKDCTSKREKYIPTVGDSKPTHQSVSLVPGHNTKKQVPCAYCPRKFPTKYLVKRHERMHTGAQPFTCYVCNGKFRHNGSLINHIKMKHPKNDPYRCRKCQMTFKTFEDSKLHRKQHDFRRKDPTFVGESAGTANLSPVAIIKIPISRLSQIDRLISVSNKGNVCHDSDENTDSAPETEGYQNKFNTKA